MTRAAAGAALLVLALAGCGSGDRAAEATQVLMRHFRAVQDGDLAALERLLEDCRIEQLAERDSAAEPCSVRLSAALASVEAQRQLGEYRFDDPWGFGLARALVLGRGGWWRVESLAETAPGRWQVDLLVRTHYRPDETRRLPRGAVVEYLVEPLGRVRRLARGGSGPGALREQLVELRLRAELSLREDGWRVVSVRALPETAVFESVSWRPS